MIEAQPGRVLVVDDVEVNRDLLIRRVRRIGHSVEEAPDGQAALDRLRSDEPYDVVLLDVMMPGLNGYDVLERIKQDPELANTRVIMVSAVDEIDSVVRCIGLGADDYLTKPFNPVVLEARLRSSMARKQLEDAQRMHAEALERELEIGREIQAGFFPPALPDVAPWLIAAHFESARQVAGDFYDAFVVAGDRVVLVVGDVCDKGVGAALYMALFRSLIRSHATESSAQLPAADLIVTTLARTNDYIATVHDEANMFATAVVAVAEPDGTLTIANAGHDAPIVRRSTGELEAVGVSGPALGLMPDAGFGTAQLSLNAGDVVIVTTDGVTEAAAADGAFLGDERLHETIRHASGDVHEIVAGVAMMVTDHRQDALASDDVTILGIARRWY